MHIPVRNESGWVVTLTAPRTGGKGLHGSVGAVDADRDRNNRNIH